MDYTSPPAMALRRFGTKLGVLRPAQRLYRRIFNVDYEAAFDRACEARLRPGDCAWDVGANNGHYSLKYAALVGADGLVVTFEPSPQTFEGLCRLTEPYPNIVNRNVALSTEDGTAAFFVSGEDSVIDGLSRASVGDNGHEVVVTVCRGDAIAQEFPPNFIKIDVEGFEYDVLVGLSETLLSPDLHTVAVEVHFQTMARRGLTDGPIKIGKLLKEKGFALRWTDPSHLIASRPGR